MILLLTQLVQDYSLVQGQCIIVDIEAMLSDAEGVYDEVWC